jgi:hypothetical protein
VCPDLATWRDLGLRDDAWERFQDDATFDGCKFELTGVCGYHCTIYANYRRGVYLLCGTFSSEEQAKLTLVKLALFGGYV